MQEAGDVEMDVYSLKNLTSLEVGVEYLPKDSRGLSVEQIKHDLEARLLEASLVVSTKGASLRPPTEGSDSIVQAGLLYIRVTILNIIDSGPGLYGYYIDTQVRQWANLNRMPSFLTLVTTWSSGYLGAAPGNVLPTACMSALHTQVDKLIAELQFISAAG